MVLPVTWLQILYDIIVNGVTFPDIIYVTIVMWCYLSRYYICYNSDVVLPFQILYVIIVIWCYLSRYYIC